MRINPIYNANLNVRRVHHSEKPEQTTSVPTQNTNFKGHVKNLFNSGNFGSYPMGKAVVLFDNLWQRAVRNGGIINRRAAEIFQNKSYNSLVYKLTKLRNLNLDHEEPILGGVNAYNKGLKFRFDDIEFSVDRNKRLQIIEPYDELYFHENGMIRKYTHHSSDYSDTYSVRYHDDGSESFLNILPLGF